MFLLLSLKQSKSKLHVTGEKHIELESFNDFDSEVWHGKYVSKKMFNFKLLFNLKWIKDEGLKFFSFDLL